MLKAALFGLSALAFSTTAFAMPVQPLKDSNEGSTVLVKSWHHAPRGHAYGYWAHRRPVYHGNRGLHRGWR